MDSIDGAGGVDTLNVVDAVTVTGAQYGIPAGVSIKNIENIVVATTGGINMDVKAIAGLEKLTTKAAGTANTTVTAADTTDVATTVVGTATTTIAGGKAVSVTGGTAGATGVTGKGLESVTVKGGGAVTINNQENSVAATANKGTTLKSVTLDGVNAASGIGGEGLESVTIKGATAGANTVTITNAKAGHALTVNVDGTGYDTSATAKATTVVDAAATSITVNATGAKSNLTLTGSTAAKTVNITGSADLTLAALASATKIDGSAATGALTLGDLNAATVTVSTGAGKDSFAIQATTKVAVDAGAGDDTVTVKSVIAAGSTINLGAGNDKLLFGTGGAVAASTASAITVIDGGDGIDTVSALLINAGNGAQFKNFDLIDASGNGTAKTVDTTLLTGSTITGSTLSGGTGGVTISNFTGGLTVSGANTGTTTFAVAGAVANTADVFDIAFDGAAAAAAPTTANVTAGTISLANIETINVVSGGGANTWNSLTISDDAAKSIVITGAQNLDLSITQTVASSKVALTSIDGSAATGKLTITEVSALHTGSALTIKGGSAADTIIVGASGATVTGNGGNDLFNVGAAKSNVTAAAGATNIADLAGTLVKTVITDFTAGDKIALVANTAGDTATFTSAKIDVSAATNLGGALDLAAAAVAATTASVTTWFVWGGDSYLVNDNSAATTLDANDVVIKLAGVTDLSNSALVHDTTTGANIFTFA